MCARVCVRVCMGGRVRALVVIDFASWCVNAQRGTVRHGMVRYGAARYGRVSNSLVEFVPHSEGHWILGLGAGLGRWG